MNRISNEAVSSSSGRSQGQSSEAQAQSVDLSIVLVNWNSLHLTTDALASLESFTKDIRYEVFVIDNGTTKDDGIRELPRRFPWIHFISNGENRGFSKANNQGIRRAKGRYILLLNNDTIQIENALGKAVAYMDAHPDVGALGITHLNRDAEQSFQPSFFAFPRPWTEVRALLGAPEAHGASPVDFSREQEADWIVGSFLLMRRACYEDVGELDERFFIYDEDVDWCFRARRAGWMVKYWPGARMVHLGASARPFMKDKTFVHFRSHLSYIKKNHSLSAAVAYYGAMGARLALATGKQAALAATGRTDLSTVRERIFRQRQFMLLRSGRTGG
jgi:GT2 family glycosyltransferase